MVIYIVSIGKVLIQNFCVRIMKNVSNALGWLLLNKATQICMLSSKITTLKSRQKNYVGGIS